MGSIIVDKLFNSLEDECAAENAPNLIIETAVCMYIL